MSNFTFEKSELINLEQSLYKEILRTNRAGSYSSTSIIGCNTRKYHGLLVVPLPEFGMTRHVLLSSLDVTIVQHESEFNLGIHKYNGQHFDPKGHKYMREVAFDIIPRKVYRVGGVLLEVEEVLVEEEEQFLVKYTLLEAHSNTKIKLKPFLANRCVHELTHENLDANTKYSNIMNGISIHMYPKIPELYMQLSKQGEFVANPMWNKGVEYFKEARRGYYFQEDLYVPGYFEFDIEKGESVVFSASLKEWDPYGFESRFNEEVEKRIPRDTPYTSLLNSAVQFFVSKGDVITMVAGYYWYKDRLRDTLIALPQLTEALDDSNLFEKVLESSCKTITEYLTDTTVKDLTEADTPLWFFWTLQQCWSNNCLKEYFLSYYDFLKSILQSYLTNRFENVCVNEQGYVEINDTSKPLTWMNGIVDGKPVTPRNGICVEINALWYNALKMYLELVKDVQSEDETFIHQIEECVSKIENTFEDLFWNEKEKCLYDLIRGDEKDESVRPNQIFVAAFKFSPLKNDKKKKILDVVKEQLLTPKGLRSLSPKNPNYEGEIGGIAHQREYGLHQGTVWPWLISFYAEAYVKIHKNSGLSHIKKIALNFEEEMDYNCIGTISEYYDGNPPYKGKGAVSMAWNVAGVLKILKLIENYS